MWTLAAIAASGCTSMSDYVHNGFKVGPSYGPPQAQVAQHWIDVNDQRLRAESPDLSHWWTVFNDPVLNALICDAYRQNLTLKAAGERVMEARAQLAIARGNFFPQTQQAVGGYSRNANAAAPGVPSGLSRWTDQWNYGFRLAWELDFWGLYRRQIASADAALSQSVESYDAALVTLLGDVAAAYVNYRQAQQEIAVAKANAALQRWVRDRIQDKLNAGAVNKLDFDQAETNLALLEAGIPQFEINRRTAEDQLCILMGMPPWDLRQRLGETPIPAVSPETVVGIPAELLCRRPDVRAAQFAAASQAEQIGIAEADFYPHITIAGTLNYQAQNFGGLFRNSAFNGSIGPGFAWDILKYGSILGNVRLQDAKFQELVFTYQQTVLQANREAEDAIVTFLQAQEREKVLSGQPEHEEVRDGKTVKVPATGQFAAQEAMQIVIWQYIEGARVANVAVDFNRVAVIEQQLASEQEQLAQARGQVANGLIQIFRALGGGWQIRMAPEEGRVVVPPPAAGKPAEMIETPKVPAPPGGAPDAGKVIEKKPLPPIPEPVVAPVPIPDVKPDGKPMP
jgi:NodT family efflux transporter outer membrane factor (OMF) lipoprotein